MGKTESLIEEAILYAKGRGLRINRGGAVFNWCIRDSVYSCHMADYPVACDAIGAVLLKMGREDLVRNGFQKGWLKIVCDYLNVDPFWVYRFCIGFDSGHQILITKTKDKKETVEKEEVSYLGVRLANKYVNKT
jgi:hypothetical protein